MSQKFNIEEWLDQHTSQIKATQTSPSNSPLQGSVGEDIETITQRIEAAMTDITAGYDNWLNLGFALSDELGESGRDYYHRISRFNPDYNQSECDKQYDKCLRANGTGVTIKSFFQKAKEAGISISTSSNLAKLAECAKYATPQNANIETQYTASATANTANIAHIANIEDESPLPTFSQDIKDNLPEFLSKIYSINNSAEDADILILGALTILSACMPNISGIYDKRIIYPNLFLFVTARASAGKGRLNLCRYLVDPIHERLREINEAENMEYEQKMAEYNAAGKKKVDMVKPPAPPLRMLFIPANSSATAVYQVLNDNNGEGLMFETEGDTLANTFGSDYGNYSDGFRKAFHHETISYIRRKDREYVNIKSPRLSTLLTGTPRQILNLITDAENGLFSRFAFYYLNPKIVWNNVFDNSLSTTLEEYFQNLGEDYFNFYTILKDYQRLRFRLTIEQEQDFNSFFSDLQSEYIETCGEEFVASIRRLGVIMFRIAMCLTTLRLMEDDTFADGFIDEDLVCSDSDYQTAKRIIEVVICHNAKVFNELPKTASPITTKTSPGHANRQKAFFDALPNEFERKDYLQIASQVGMNPSSVDRIIRKWRDEGKLISSSHGHYQKS